MPICLAYSAGLHMGSKPRGDVVLLLTHSGDYFTVDRVAAALKRRGVRAFRFDTDRFPVHVKLSAKFTGVKTSHVLADRADRVAANEVRAVWARRVWPPRLASDLDPNFRALCARESMAAVEGFLDGLHSARWVNEPARDREAENKLLQLRIAAEAGLLVPRTLVTNDPKRMRSFFREVKGMMVAKLLRPVSISMDADSGFVHTSVVTKKDLDEGDLLRHSPMVFQERITKACELRIAFVGDKLFVGSIDAGNSARGQVDWRLSSPEEARWERDQISDHLAAALKALMAKLGLVYGAIDLIRTPDGEYVFLEVNPGGEWGMLERDLNYPISEAIADALLL
jgi:MvdC family ATP-grasp ribosomal peptide maturase